MAAAVAHRKRPASPLLADEVVPAPPHLAKRGRFSPCPAVAAQRQASERDAAARVASASSVEERAGVLVEQMSAAGARSRASWVLKLIEGAVAERAAAALRRGVAAQHRRQEELERDNGVLKRGVAVLHRQQEGLKKKVAGLVAANYELGVRSFGAGSCRFQDFRGPDVF